MKYKEAKEILLKLMEKLGLDAKEKQAIMTAVGLLDSGNLFKNSVKRMIKAKKDKKEKDLEW